MSSTWRLTIIITYQKKSDILCQSLTAPHAHVVSRTESFLKRLVVSTHTSLCARESRLSSILVNMRKVDQVIPLVMLLQALALKHGRAMNTGIVHHDGISIWRLLGNKVIKNVDNDHGGDCVSCRMVNQLALLTQKARHI